MKQIKHSFLIAAGVMSAGLIVLSLILGIYNTVLGFLGSAIALICLGVFTVIYFTRNNQLRGLVTDIE